MIATNRQVKCQDCEQRDAEYRIHYRWCERTLDVCGVCAQFDWVSVNLAGNADYLESIEDGRLLAWGDKPKAETSHV